jgi:hypothetical protein
VDEHHVSNASAKLRGSVAFPAAGEGVYLQLRTSEYIALADTFGEEWFTTLTERLDRYDIRFLTKFLEIAGKRDVNGTLKKHPVVLDDIDAPLVEVARVVLDTIFFSIHGKSYADYVEEAMKKIRDNKFRTLADDNPDPPTGPENSSADSEAPPSGQA